MIIKYFPEDNLIVIDTNNLRFNEKRELVRNRLGLSNEEDNSIFEAGDSDPDPIIVRRDIYLQEINDQYFFILHYDKEDLLSEVEIINCARIQIKNAVFNFDDEIDSIALLLEKFSEIRIVSEGEYFFRDLGVVISDKRKRGGGGSTLGYFYCSADVSHL